MESNMPSGLFSNPAMLGLEVQLSQPQQQSHHNHNHHHHQPQQRSPQNPNHHFLHHQNQHSQISILTQPETEPHVKQGSSFSPIAKHNPNTSLLLSDEEDPIFTSEECDPKRKISPWQRMKWTDNMVRLLINEVYTIGDEGGLPESAAADPSGKKKPSGGAMQKKGKWKSVSQAMMEKGFFVSPQQCEDKFNDLNKRYKRVNDILGKGISCKVVENQSLLDSMDQIPSKTKDEVRKLLNSKHLFFREMCAYHNNCASVATTMVDSSSSSHHLLHCKNSDGGFVGGPKLSEEDDDEADDDEDDEEEDEEDEYDDAGNGIEETNERGTKRRQLVFELNNVVHDVGRSLGEKRHWLRAQLVQLEEQRVGYEYEAFELEKQRLKWMKYSGKKERDMEHMKLRNERMKLENERMVLIIRQREMELQDFACNKKGEIVVSAPPPTG